MLRMTTRIQQPRLGLLVSLCLTAACSATDSVEQAPVATEGENLYAAGWEDFGRTATDVAVSATSSTQLDAWSIGSNGAVWHAAVINGVPTGGWENSAGKPDNKTLTSVAAAQVGATTNIVATDSSGAVWARQYSSGAWGSWATVGQTVGYAQGNVAAAAVGTNRLDVYRRGSDNNLWHARTLSDGSWSAWSNDGAPSGGLQSSPAAVTRSASPFVADVAVRGTNNSIWHRAYASGAWQAWEQLGGATEQAPAIVSKNANEVSILVKGTGTDETLYQTTFSGTAWSSYSTVPLPTSGTVGSPAATYFSDRLETFMRGSANNVWRRSQLFDRWEAMTIVGLVGKCMALDPAYKTASGRMRAVLQACNGSQSQSWKRVGETYVNYLYNQCLNVENAGTATGTAVIGYPCSATPATNERWELIPKGNGMAKLRGVGSQKCLIVNGGNRADGSGLVISDCAGDLSTTRWYPGDGTAQRIRVKVFLLLKDDESYYSDTALATAQANFDATLAQVNDVYQRAGMYFEAAHQEWVQYKSTLLDQIGNEATPAQDTAAYALAAQNPGFVTLLLADGGGGYGYFPARTDDYVKMAEGVPFGTLAHEFGHYFNLAHSHTDTYPTCNTPATPGVDCYNTNAWNRLASFQNNIEAAFDNDGIQDTPADAGPWIFERRAGMLYNPARLPGNDYENCGGSDSITIFNPLNTNATATLTPDRRNVMGYYYACGGTLRRSVTPGQIGQMRAALFGPYRKHLVERIQ